VRLNHKLVCRRPLSVSQKLNKFCHLGKSTRVQDVRAAERAKLTLGPIQGKRLDPRQVASTVLALQTSDFESAVFAVLSGRMKFYCKTTQPCAKPCQRRIIKIRSVSNGMQCRENVRKLFEQIVASLDPKAN
jgi:hypothetical protein